MVVERELLTFFEWLPAGLLVCGVTLLALVLGGSFFGFLVTAIRNGPAAAIAITGTTIRTAIRELFETSPRRVWALSALAFREAIRRWVLVVFAIFLAILLFAGWFLDPAADHPGRLYLSFVLTSTNFLILMLAIFLSAFSLPNDVKNRTIYTVVTKPVRAWEIVLGRIIGFSTIGTLLLAIMGVFSYVFVVRGLSHTHAIDDLTITELQVEVGGETVTVREAQSTNDNRHRHELRITDYVRVEANHDHTHGVTGTEQGEVKWGSAEGNLLARVPEYGKLTFWDKDGKVVDKGVNVGNEWAYRSYIEGGTLATAIWTFQGLHRQDFKDGIPLEMTIRVFRTYKGDVERGIFGSIQVVEADDSPPGQPPKPIDARRRYAKINFTAREFTSDQQPIPISHEGFEPDGTERLMYLFDDLVHDGKLEIHIQCGEKAQYFGVAQADVYIRAVDGYFWMNFAKGFLGIWFQMVIATCFAVMFSTFLNGAVAMLSTVAAIFLGFVANFVMGLFTGEVEGGGPSEAMVRMFTQKNMIIELEAGVTTSVLKGFDFVVMSVMAGICRVLPNFGGFNTSEFVAAGFDISNDLVVQHVLITMAYVAALTTVGYFFLKTREVGA